MLRGNSEYQFVARIFLRTKMEHGREGGGLGINLSTLVKTWGFLGGGANLSIQILIF